MTAPASAGGLQRLSGSWSAVIAVAAVIGGAGLSALILASDHYRDRYAFAVLGPLVGWNYVATGLYAWRRRPESRFGAILVALGFAWFLAALDGASSPVVYTLAVTFQTTWLGLFMHMLLSFPTGRLETSSRRWAAAAAYVAFGLGYLPVMLVSTSDAVGLCAGSCPRNVLQITHDAALGDVLLAAAGVLQVGVVVIVAGMLIRRWRRAGAAARRALAPVYMAGAATVALAAAYGATRTHLIAQLAVLGVGLTPFGFLAGLLRARLARAAVADLVVALERDSASTALRDALARTLGDPSLELAYWLPEFGTYADLDGHRVDVGARDGRSVTVIRRASGPVAALLHDSALCDERELLDAVCAAAGIALENARLRAELHARLDELRGSRARIVEATRRERQRLERNLHDGAQQRLVTLSLELGMLESRLAAQPELQERLGQVRAEAATCLQELRVLARGLHPAVVTDHGLTVALEGLATRCPVPVRLDLELPDRVPQDLEVAAYFMVAESLTNVAKYARATHATVAVRRERGEVVVEVIDDGVGGASTEGGTGLRGLADRVEALDGRLLIWSPDGGGTRVRAEIPCP
jgi:signal transduction histidine kinase